MSSDASRIPVKPFLLQTDEDGSVRLTVRTTRFNQWNYPVVTATLVDEAFATLATARAYAKKHFGAETGQFTQH